MAFSPPHERCVLAHQLAPERLRDQRPRLRDPVQRHERAEARAAFLPEQDAVQRREPGLGHAGAPVRSLLGRHQALDPRLVASRPAVRGEASGSDDGPGSGYSREEEAEVRERLQALGYVE